MTLPPPPPTPTPRPTPPQDEPTSGLDARAAAIVMRAVKNVALSNRTVMVTIHQPTTEIFENFDYLVLLQVGGWGGARLGGACGGWGGQGSWKRVSSRGGSPPPSAPPTHPLNPRAARRAHHLLWPPGL